MLSSRRLSYLIGAATLWIPLYMVAFLAVMVVQVVTQSDFGSGSPPPAFLALVVLHVFTMLVAVGLIAVYLVDVFRNPDLADKQDMRITWAVLVIVLSTFAMVVYWWLYLRPGSDSFQRRRTAAQVT